MGRKCGVEGCLSDSNRPEDTGVTFHKVPSHNDIRPKWFSLCRIPDERKSGGKIIYICSRHFLRVDFCSYRGKKYMLRQGVLPSVFPWDKSKLEAIKGAALPLNEPENAEIKEEKEPNVQETEFEVRKEKLEMDLEAGGSSVNGIASFAINARIEALDNDSVWCPARIMEQDYEENEVLVHFEKFASKFDEWIAMDSPRLRPVQAQAPKKKEIEQFTVGERCLATWSDARKFPATVTKVLLNDTYEVLFDDGFVKNLRAHRMCKSSPLFNPVQSTKAERRERKRKLNVAQLFNKKRSKYDHDEKPQKTKPVPASPVDQQPEIWLPQWDNGRPIGEESSIETSDGGSRKSTIVADPRLPPGWTKHLSERTSTVGKWDVFIISPDGRKFRSKADVRNYLEDTKIMPFNPAIFDFSLHKQRTTKKKTATFNNSLDTSHVDPVFDDSELNTTAVEPLNEEENKNCLKIPLVDNSYRCPIEGCGKSYRRENLAQMHVKHYHPEYTKFLDSTPNVADLAYARTVGAEPSSFIEKQSSGVNKNPPTPLHTTNKTPQNRLIDTPTQPSSKDSEIMKLLNTTNKSLDIKKEIDTNKPLPAGLPSNMYPDIKLKDLLTKSEGIPPRDDINLRLLSATRPPVGIKTLLPVVRAKASTIDKSNIDFEYSHKPRTNFKRKSAFFDSFSPKGTSNDHLAADIVESTPVSNNNTIIEGGRVIKIVRMKQEEIINCTCGYSEEDGLMIQCDLCLCWQHAFCNSIERESQVPEKYVCLICQNPAKQRSSMKYFHDQDWLKHGVLASASFHSKDEDLMAKRFERLKKAHDLSGGLNEINDYVHTLKVKLKIAEVKNHPKLYLWSKPWEKPALPEKEPKEDEIIDESIEKSLDLDNQIGSTKIETKKMPIIPEPEAAIDSADCRLNLLEHISHSQTLVDERLDDLEEKINELEANYVQIEDGNDYPRLRQTLNMLLRDLATLQEFSQRVTISQ